MPELPEVQTIVSCLAQHVPGRPILAARLLRPDVLRPLELDLASHLCGRHFGAVTRRGKKIVFNLNDGNRLCIHLGMTGRLTLETPATPLLPHTHLIVDLQQPDATLVQLRFCDPRRFGGVWWLGSDISPDENLGPEPLTIRPAQLARRLGRTARAIKNALLDQSLLAGLGNIYVDESLFLAKIHPLTRADRLSDEQARRLCRAIKLILRRAIRHRGSTLRDYRDANGQPGAFRQLHRVYDRAGEPCFVCKRSIQRIIVVGRSTHFCARCQPRRTITGSPNPANCPR